MVIDHVFFNLTSYIHGVCRLGREQTRGRAATLQLQVRLGESDHSSRMHETSPWPLHRTWTAAAAATTT